MSDQETLDVLKPTVCFAQETSRRYFSFTSGLSDLGIVGD
jgi:hypothetical protein